MAPPPARRGYLDWLRGVAVLIMIETHLLDSWMRAPDRQTDAFAAAMTAGGIGAPLFLFLAGAAVPLAAGSRLRRGVPPRQAAQPVFRRGLQIFGLAFLFRIQAFVLGASSPWQILKVDILNIMGPCIMAAAAIWGRLPSGRARAAALGAAMLAVTLLTPIVRAAPWLSALPDPLEAYLRPIPDLNNFVFFPWAGFAFAGAAAGLLLDAARSHATERRLNLVVFGAGGAAVILLAHVGSMLPSLYPVSSYWTSAPSFFFLRVGLVMVAVALAHAWESRPGAEASWSPVRQLGRSSLFIYWIHVEMVYGLISLPWHKALSWRQSWAALVLFSVFMLACTVARDRLVAWRRARAARSPA